MKARLKPMGIREILDNSFTILRERFWTFQAVNFLSFLPAFMIMCLMGAVFFMIIYRFNLKAGPHFLFSEKYWQQLYDKAGVELMSGLALLGLLFFLFLAAVIIGAYYFAYANTKLFKCGLHGEECTIKEAFQGLKGKKRRFFALQVILFLIGFIISFLSEHPLLSIRTLGVILYYFMIYVEFLFCLTPVVLCLENKNLFDSLSRAFTLLSRHRWRVFILLFVVYFLAYALLLIILGLLAIPIVVAAIIKDIVSIIAVGIFSLGALLVLNIFLSYFFGPLTAIYYDLLIRKEGYDLKLQLAENQEESTIKVPERGMSF